MELNQPLYSEKSEEFKNIQNSNVHDVNNVAYEENNIESNIESVRDWIILIVLMSIPIVNLVVAIVWIRGNKLQKNMKTYVLASIIMTTIQFVLISIFVIAIFVSKGAITNMKTDNDGNIRNHQYIEFVK